MRILLSTTISRALADGLMLAVVSVDTLLVLVCVVSRDGVLSATYYTLSNTRLNDSGAV